MSENKKRILGQFFTKNNFWLKEHIRDFIKSTKTTTVLDPFAGHGDILNVASDDLNMVVIGYDIDENFGWDFNDSLVNIPKVENSIIITNPPYLTNYSAKRKKIYDSVEMYFTGNTEMEDLYLISIKKCMEHNDFGIMIIPETFISTTFNKERIVSITTIEDNMFNDTETPVCVICFDNVKKGFDKIKIYKNDEFIDTLNEIVKFKRKPTKQPKIKFNSPTGKLALRAVDTTNPLKPILFMRPEELKYDLSTIKHSSRLITLIEINSLKDEDLDRLIKLSNDKLFQFRKNTRDVLLSPFKGNNKNGERRRRLDYETARMILEDTIKEM